MNAILKLLEERNLYVHIMLYKIYVSHNGMIHYPPDGNLREEIKTLLGEDFSNENYRIAEEYLESEGYVVDTFMGLTSYGRTYFENWIRNFEDLNLEEREQLQKELSPKMYDFFGLAEKAKTILDVISKLIEINDKV